MADYQKGISDEDWQKLNEIQQMEWKEGDFGATLARQHIEQLRKMRDVDQLMTRTEMEESVVMDWDRYVHRAPLDEFDVRGDPKLEEIDAVYRDPEGFAVDSFGQRAAAANDGSTGAHHIPRFPVSRRGKFAQSFSRQQAFAGTSEPREVQHSLVSQRGRSSFGQSMSRQESLAKNAFCCSVSGNEFGMSFSCSRAHRQQDIDFAESRFKLSQINFQRIEEEGRTRIREITLARVEQNPKTYYKNFEVPYEPFRIPVKTQEEKEEELKSISGRFNATLARLLPWYRKTPRTKEDGTIIPIRRCPSSFKRAFIDELHMVRLQKLVDANRRVREPELELIHADE